MAAVSAPAIVEFARAGGRVYALAGLPAASAENGLADPEMKKLMEALRAEPTFTAVADGALAPLLDRRAPGLESPVRMLSGAFPMLQHRRRIDGRDFFWLANNSEDWQACEMEFGGVSGAVSIWDCETGETRPVASADDRDGARLALVFKPLEAYWVVFDPRGRVSHEPRERLPEVDTVASLDGPWTVRFDAAVQPVMEFPVTPPAAFAAGVERPLEDWKAWGLGKFSGLLDYAKTVTVAAPTPDILLDLGEVRHAAEVWVNGRSCGARLWGPHVFEVGPALRTGANEVRVRVANLINNTYGEPVASGLLGPVRLVRLR